MLSNLMRHPRLANSSGIKLKLHFFLFLGKEAQKVLMQHSLPQNSNKISVRLCKEKILIYTHCLQTYDIFRVLFWQTQIHHQYVATFYFPSHIQTAFKQIQSLFTFQYKQELMGRTRLPVNYKHILHMPLLKHEKTFSGL